MSVIVVEVIELELLTGTPEDKESHSFSRKNIRNDGSYVVINQDSSGLIHYKDGSVYDGELNFRCQPHGQGKMTFPDARLWQGLW